MFKSLLLRKPSLDAPPLAVVGVQGMPLCMVDLVVPFAREVALVLHSV